MWCSVIYTCIKVGPLLLTCSIEACIYRNSDCWTLAHASMGKEAMSAAWLYNNKDIAATNIQPNYHYINPHVPDTGDPRTSRKWEKLNYVGYWTYCTGLPTKHAATLQLQHIYTVVYVCYWYIIGQQLSTLLTVNKWNWILKMTYSQLKRSIALWERVHTYPGWWKTLHNPSITL